MTGLRAFLARRDGVAQIALVLGAVGAVLSRIDSGSPTSPALSNPVAAGPSLHAAYAVGVGIGMITYGRWLAVRLAGAAYPPLVVLTIVVTGNHFLLDAVAGIVVLGAGFALVRVARRTGEGGRACAA